MRFRLFFFFLIGAAFCQGPSFHSQACQDQFVYLILYEVLGKQDPGYYLEIGAGDPVSINNSYFLEKNLDWKGVSLDINQDFSLGWATQRKNRFLCEDATQSNYSLILSDFPPVIDYLSLDVDERYDAVLRRLLLSKKMFKVITIEHDAYRFGDLYRMRERKMLSQAGYYLLCADVCNCGAPFEDWWIHPSFFPPEIFSKLISLDLKGRGAKEMIEMIREGLF